MIFDVSPDNCGGVCLEALLMPVLRTSPEDLSSKITSSFASLMIDVSPDDCGGVCLESLQILVLSTSFEHLSSKITSSFASLIVDVRPDDFPSRHLVVLRSIIRVSKRLVTLVCTRNCSSAYQITI